MYFLVALMTVTLLLPLRCAASLATPAPLTPIPSSASPPTTQTASPLPTPAATTTTTASPFSTTTTSTSTTASPFSTTSTSTTTTSPVTSSTVPLPSPSSIPATAPPPPVAVFVLVLNPNVTIDNLKLSLNSTLRIPLEAIVVLNSAVVSINTPSQTPQPSSSVNTTTPQPSAANNTNTTKSHRFDTLDVKQVIQVNITFSGSRAQDYASSMSSATSATLASIGVNSIVVAPAASSVPIATGTPAPAPAVSHSILILSVALAVSGVIVAVLFTVALVYYSKRQYQREMAEKSAQDKKLLSVPLREQPQRRPQQHQARFDDEMALL